MSIYCNLPKTRSRTCCHPSSQISTKEIDKQRNNCGPTIILGDLNCPRINWSNYATSDSTNVDNLFHSYIIRNGFVQCINEPTRGGNILDVVCINEPVLIRDIHVEAPFSNSDHETILFDIDTPSSESTITQTNSSKHYIWSKADYDIMTKFLNTINWSELFTTNFNPDDIWKAFCKILDKAIELSVPAVTTCNISKRNIKRYPRPIQDLFTRKLAVWRFWRADHNNQSLRQQYNKLNAECRRAVRDYEISRENNIIQSNDLGKFYRYVNGKMTCRSGIGSLKSKSGIIVTSDAEKADILNDYFTSVCTKDNGIIPPFNVQLPTGAVLDTVSFDIPKLIKAIKKIKNKNKISSGPDGYPIKLLTTVAPALLEPLSLMYNSFMSVGKMPTSWKTATVTPIYKKGRPSDPSNYRPISQTSVFCKLMERVIVADITEYLLKHKLLNPSQHGFLARRSTLTNLLECTSDWTMSIDCRRISTVIYIDFSKAFDSVCHTKLLSKLATYGIT